MKIIIGFYTGIVSIDEADPADTVDAIICSSFLYSRRYFLAVSTSPRD